MGIDKHLLIILDSYFILLSSYHRFPCGRWLGREVDDGSTERLLVGEQFYESGGGGGGVGGSGNGDELVAQTPPPRARSPSVPRRDDNLRNPVEIQECLGWCIYLCMHYLYNGSVRCMHGAIRLL